MDQVDEIISGIEGKVTASAVGRRMCVMGLSGQSHLALARQVCDRLELVVADSTLADRLSPSRYTDEHAESGRELSRIWHAQNRERSRENTRRWRSENPELSRESSRRWHAQNRERSQENTRRWRSENPELSRESGRKCTQRWQEENPARKCLSYSKRRARDAGLPFDLTLEHVERLMAPMRCSVTGLPVSTTWDGDGTNPWAPSLDQMHPGAGYLSSNVRVTCWAYNRLKAEMDDATVRRFAEALVRGEVTPDPANGKHVLNAKILHYSFSAAKLGGWRKGAKARGLDFDISRDWVDAQLATGVCSMTGLRLSTESVGHMNPLAPSIDRIDCSKGYHPKNCRMVSWWYNNARGSWDDSVPLAVARALVS